MTKRPSPSGRSGPRLPDPPSFPVRRLARSAALAGTTARRATRLASDSGDVIAARMALAATAMANPVGADGVEFHRMVSEKVTAFSAASQIMAGRCATLGVELARLGAKEAVEARRGFADLALAGSPAAVLAAQARLVGGFWGRAWANAALLAQLGLRAQNAALAPVHRTASANARRLRR